MKTVFLLFDSQNRLMLEPYGCTILETPNFRRLADGGATYHTRYNSFEFIRGQESDPWKVLLDSPIERIQEKYHHSQNDINSKQNPYHYMINREFIKEEADFPSVQCLEAGFNFLDTNRKADNWFLQIETFDPHEPFFAPERFREPFKVNYNGPILDWLRYERVTEPQDEINELRANYFALLSLCDFLLGQTLDYFDEKGLWDDTALIVATDHGFLLGEHDWWAKNRMPLDEQISHIPLLIYHPDHKNRVGERRKSLTQTIDLMPTMCELYGAPVPSEVEGKSMLALLERDDSDRPVGMFGYWGGGINVIDGRYTYFCYPKDMQNQDLYQYTLMPAHMTKLVTVDELKSASLVAPFDFTKGVPLLRIAHKSKADTKTHSYHFPEKMEDTNTVLYDLETDPGQTTPVEDPAVMRRLNEALFRMMAENDAPAEAVRRMRESLEA